MLKGNRNYPDLDIWGRPILWHLCEIPRVKLERWIVDYARRVRKNNPMAWVSTNKIWCYACWVEFQLRQLKDLVPDSAFRV